MSMSPQSVLLERPARGREVSDNALVGVYPILRPIASAKNMHDADEHWKVTIRSDMDQT